MKAYLQLTLERAKELVESGDKQWWAEARLAVEALRPFSTHYLYCTFVRPSANESNMRLKAGLAQVILVIGLKGGVKYGWGDALDYDEPCVVMAKQTQILASVVEIPQGSRQPIVTTTLSLRNDAKGAKRRTTQ